MDLIKILDIFKKYKLHLGRCFGSKSAYSKYYKYHKVIFNSSIVVKHNNKVLKVWSGDIDIHKDIESLKKVSKEINKKLYILKETDGWFNTTTTKEVLLESIWDTSKLIEKINKKYVMKKKRKEIINKKQLIENKNKRDKKQRKENKKYKIKDNTYLFKDRPIIFEMEIPYEYLDNNINLIKKKYPKKSSIKGYFTQEVLENYINNVLHIDNDDEIEVSSYWITEKTNQKLKKYDFNFESYYDKDFRDSDFKRDCTCNLCIISIELSNKNKINIKSFDDDKIYVLKEYKRKKFIF